MHIDPLLYEGSQVIYETINILWEINWPDRKKQNEHYSSKIIAHAL